MNDPDSPIRIAIIGAGNVAETSHLPAIRAQGPSADVVAVVDVDPERARVFAERWYISACYRVARIAFVISNCDGCLGSLPPYR